MKALYDYQKKYLENMPKNVVMTADVGLGKTIMALQHYVNHAPGGNNRWPIVVIAPASKVRTGDWQREIENFFDGDPPTHRVISYEMFVKQHHLLIGQTTTLIVDECHMACNATTRRARAIIKTALVAHQWIFLSATPLPNGWRSGETYALLTGLVRTKTTFVQRFQRIDRSRGFPLLLGYNETDVLDKWWATIARPLKRTGDMVLPSENIPVSIAMEPKTLKLYQRAVKQRVLRVGDGPEEELLDNPSKLFSALRQIPTPARVDALQSIVEGTDEHIVIFYNFNTERDAILAMLKKSFKTRKVYEQSGHQSNLPSRDKWPKLKPSVTLVQYQSGSQAIELTYASITVYFSPCTSFANYEQSKGRTRRNGQTKTTLFYHIAAQDTLDRHIWVILKKKRDFSTDMMNKLLQGDIDT